MFLGPIIRLAYKVLTRIFPFLLAALGVCVYAHVDECATNLKSGPALPMGAHCCFAEERCESALERGAPVYNFPVTDQSRSASFFHARLGSESIEWSDRFCSGANAFFLCVDATTDARSARPCLVASRTDCLFMRSAYLSLYPIDIDLYTCRRG